MGRFIGHTSTQTSLSVSTSDVMQVASSDLFIYFVQTLIANGVPTFFVLLTIYFAASAFRRDKDEDGGRGSTVIDELYSDLYDEGPNKQGGFSFGPRRKRPTNVGVPSQQFIKIKSLNKKLDSYEFSMNTATKSKAAAAATYRSKSFDRALQLALEGPGDSSPLPSYAKSKLLELEKEFLTKGKRYVTQLQALQSQLAQEVIDEELKSMGIERVELDPVPANETAANEDNKDSSKFSMPSMGKGKTKELQEIGKVQREITQLEFDFIKDVVAAVGKERAIAVRTALLGDIAARGTGSLLQQLEERPLSQLLKGLQPEGESKNLFVARFIADTTASQVANLREEVTAIIRNAKAGDEVLLVLQTGGGTVTGYGLAAAQLLRLKEKGLKLTIAVEQVAASGGYMIACSADKIIASPFAVLGSVGVISEIPNVYERLKTEGM